MQGEDTAPRAGDERPRRRQHNREGPHMGRLIVLGVFVCAAIAALGFYLGWFKVSTHEAGNNIDVNLRIDREKVKQSEEKAREKIEEVGEGLKKKPAKPAQGDVPAESREEYEKKTEAELNDFD